MMTDGGRQANPFHPAKILRVDLQIRLKKASEETRKRKKISPDTCNRGSSCFVSIVLLS